METVNAGMTIEQELESLRAENAKLRKETEAIRKEALLRGIRFKVSVKGAISIYGLGRFPLTVYKETADRLFSPEVVDAFMAFRWAHDGELASKGDRIDADTDTATVTSL